MSTKTTFKRVALVAVAALGFGVLSVVPSNAAIGGDSLTLSATTAAITTADTATGVSATLKFAGTEAVDSISVQADFVSGPAVFKPYLVLAETSTVTIDGVAAPAKGRIVYPSESTTVVAGSSSAFNSAKWSVLLANPTDITKAATTAGTYVVKLTPKAQGSGVLIGSAAQTLTITVTAAASLSTVANAALSTSYINAGDTVAATSDDTVLVSKDLATAASAIIKVTQKNAAGGSANESMTVTISGPGTLNAGAFSGTASGLGKTGARALTVKNGDVIAVFADGNSGVGTITIATSGGTLATETVTFYDTKPATITATVKKAYILAGSQTTNVFAVVVKDAAGNAVTNATITAAATDTTTTVGGAADCTTGFNTTDLVYYCAITGLSATKFGKVNYTIKATGEDTAGTVVSTTADVTFSAGVAAKVVVAGPTTAEPGAKVAYTITMTDANGYPVADQKYGLNAVGKDLFSQTASKLTVSGFASGSAPFAISDSWTSVSGVITSYGVLPVAGTGSVTWTLAGDGVGGGTDAIATALEATTITVKTLVANPAIDAATDAANEATDAANAATDAANAAAEAADAATAAAQDAADAVAALSTQVNDLISALKAQLTSLTKIVVKIQKKLGIK